jgi:hypothetical protein
VSESPHSSCWETKRHRSCLPCWKSNFPARWCIVQGRARRSWARGTNRCGGESQRRWLLYPLLRKDPQIRAVQERSVDDHEKFRIYDSATIFFFAAEFLVFFRWVSIHQSTDITDRKSSEVRERAFQCPDRLRLEADLYRRVEQSNTSSSVARYAHPYSTAAVPVAVYAWEPLCSWRTTTNKRKGIRLCFQRLDDRVPKTRQS